MPTDADLWNVCNKLQWKEGKCGKKLKGGLFSGIKLQLGVVKAHTGIHRQQLYIYNIYTSGAISLCWRRWYISHIHHGWRETWREVVNLRKAQTVHVGKEPLTQQEGLMRSALLISPGSQELKLPHWKCRRKWSKIASEVTSTAPISVPLHPTSSYTVTCTIHRYAHL